MGAHLLKYSFIFKIIVVVVCWSLDFEVGLRLGLELGLQFGLSLRLG